MSKRNLRIFAPIADMLSLGIINQFRRASSSELRLGG
jgi:hypothetical protein